MSNKHNTIRYLVENLTDETWMNGIISNMTNEDLHNLLQMLESMSDEIQERWYKVIKETKLIF